MPSGALAPSPDAAAPKPDGEVFVQVSNLHKEFNGHTAVKDVSLDIRRGEIFGLLGPNGAGKTTTIRMLATTLRPTSGEVVIGGHPLSTAAHRIKDLIGVCPQDIALYPELSAQHNLVFFGQMGGLSLSAAKTMAAKNLELVGLTERARERVARYSGGMKRRVNLAAALMSRPELLFLDEPTVGVDPQSRNRIFEVIVGLRDQGMTLVYTTHYMEEADRLCDRVGIMDEGRLVALDSPDKLKARSGDPAQVTLEDVFLNLTGRRLRDGAGS